MDELRERIGERIAELPPEADVEEIVEVVFAEIGRTHAVVPIPSEGERSVAALVGAGHVIVAAPIDRLVFAAEHSPLLEWPSDKGSVRLKVIDRNAFAAAVATEIMRDDEDGSSPAHDLFDLAFNRAIEGGSAAVEWAATPPASTGGGEGG